MLLYAHRGANLRLPENTIEAFRQGLQDGATALEMDIRATSDDVIIVFHDSDGLRMANQKKMIAKTPWGEVKNWDVGEGLRRDPVTRHFVDRACRIPTLEEILVAFPNVFLNVDIKPSSLRVTSLVIELIRRHRATDRVRLTSFHWRVHNMLHALRYEGPVGLSSFEAALVYFVPEFLLTRARLRNRAMQIPTRWGPFPMDTKAFIAKGHRLGLLVDFWVVNKREDARRLIDRGADGIMTDDPAEIVPALQAAIVHSPRANVLLSPL